MVALAAWLLLSVLASRAPLAVASYGDEQAAYRRCVTACANSGCVGTSSCVASCAHGSASSLSAPLRLLWWDCAADCRYRCMREVEEERRRASLPPLKYHGKWPFLRVLGVQEPVSAATSLANAAAHAHGYARLRRAWQARAFPLRTLWGCYAALCLNAWAWSTVFHCRDTHATERLDYLSAIALLVFALFAACVRALRLFRLAQWLPLGLGLGCGLALHCFAMLFVKFDYGANVALGIAAGISQSVVLVAWTQAAKHPHRWRLLALIVAVHAASLLEVLDFPPLVGLLDAHACWHAATPALALAWWSFVEDDMRSFWPTGKGT